MISQSSRQSVLVVDDDPAVLDLVEIALGKDFAVTVVTNGRAGLSKFEAQAFDVVITDRAMPEMPGDVFAEAIKDHAPGMPIILISGHEGAEVNTTLFHSFLPKPFTRTQLLEAVGDALVAGTHTGAEAAATREA